MTQVNESPIPRPRRRKWLRRVLLPFLFLLLLAGGGIVFYVWRASNALNEVIAELDRDDPGWRLEEIQTKRKTLPDADNSALHISKVHKLLAGQLIQTEAFDKLFNNLAPQVQLSAEQNAYLQKIFGTFWPALLEARKFKDMPEGRQQITYTLDFFSTSLSGITDTREVFILLQWDAAWRAHAGAADGALESCLALQHAVRSLGDEPMLIAMLVRCAGNAISMTTLERTLAQWPFTDASDESLKRMQGAVSRELREPMLLTALRGERAGTHQVFQAIADGKAQPQIVVGGAGAQTEIFAGFPGFLTSQRIALLRFHTKLVEAAKLPDEEQDKRFLELDHNVKDDAVLVRHAAPMMIKIRQAEQRTHANMRCGLAALAAERYRIAKSQWPENLDDLVKAGFLETVPTDPFDFKLLRMKRTTDGLTIYSVGTDKIDNGGTIDRDRPTDDGTDIGFRLWDIARPRQALVSEPRP